MVPFARCLCTSSPLPYTCEKVRFGLLICPRCSVLSQSTVRVCSGIGRVVLIIRGRLGIRGSSVHGKRGTYRALRYIVDISMFMGVPRWCHFPKIS